MEEIYQLLEEYITINTNKDIMNKARIYHNPACGTSRNVLNILRHCKLDIEIILYLENPPTHAEFTYLLKEMQKKPCELLRTGTEVYNTLAPKLTKSNISDDDLISYMVKNPLLINRPIVSTSLGTKLCRPSEVVLTLIPHIIGPCFINEQGKQIISDAGNIMMDISKL